MLGRVIDHSGLTVVLSHRERIALTSLPHLGEDQAVTDEAQAAVLEPAVAVEKETTKKDDRKKQPRYHVILWNDDDHSYDYVVGMMQKLFGHTKEKGFVIAKQVDSQGRAICLTTTREHAELKRDQIHAFGPDKLISRCQGAMSSSIEPET